MAELFCGFFPFFFQVIPRDDRIRFSQSQPSFRPPGIVMNHTFENCHVKLF